MIIKHKFTVPEIIIILIFSYALLSSLFHTITRNHDSGFRRQVNCTSNQKQIALSAIIFAQENEDFLLPTEKELLGYPPDRGLKCSSAKKPPGYGYNSRFLGKKVSDFENPKLIILTADTIKDDLLIKRAADFDFRHKNKNCVIAYLDGHVVAMEEDSQGFKEAIAVNFVEKR